MKRLAVLCLLSSVLWSASGCATPPARVTAPGTDHVAEVLTHKDARAVARIYPAFFTFVANKVAELSHDLTVVSNTK